MTRVLIDASSAILLYKSGLFEQLLGLYHLVMAESVYEEVTRDGYPGAEAFKAGRLKHRHLVIQAPSENDRVHALLFSDLSLGRGEKDTLVLFLKGNGRFVIIDDGKGAGYCRKRRIPYVNALLIPKILYFCNKLSLKEQQSKFERLLALGRYSRTVVHYAENCPRHELDWFIPG